MNATSKIVKETQGNYVVYLDEHGCEFYDVWLDRLQSQQEADLQVYHMMRKNWFTPQLKQELIIAIKDYAGFKVND